jgi:hypothetical protein
MAPKDGLRLRVRTRGDRVRRAGGVRGSVRAMVRLPD